MHRMYSTRSRLCPTALGEHLAICRTETVQGSPLPARTIAHNPGISLRWEGRWGVGFPIVEDDTPDHL